MKLRLCTASFAASLVLACSKYQTVESGDDIPCVEDAYCELSNGWPSYCAAVGGEPLWYCVDNYLGATEPTSEPARERNCTIAVPGTRWFRKSVRHRWSCQGGVSSYLVGMRIRFSFPAAPTQAIPVVYVGTKELPEYDGRFLYGRVITPAEIREDPSTGLVLSGPFWGIPAFGTHRFQFPGGAVDVTVAAAGVAFDRCTVHVTAAVGSTLLQDPPRTDTPVTLYVADFDFVNFLDDPQIDSRDWAAWQERQRILSSSFVHVQWQPDPDTEATSWMMRMGEMPVTIDVGAVTGSDGSGIPPEYRGLVQVPRRSGYTVSYVRANAECWTIGAGAYLWFDEIGPEQLYKRSPFYDNGSIAIPSIGLLTACWGVLPDEWEPYYFGEPLPDNKYIGSRYTPDSCLP